MNVFSQEITIPCYDTDMNFLLKPASFMNMAQEIANRHAAVLGFGYDDLERTRTAWVLSRMHFRFLRHPKWRDKVVLNTWHKGSERLFYLRDFRMEDENGNPLVAATTSWLILNIDTRRISREVSLEPYDNTSCKENALEESCGKITMPAGLEKEPAGVHKVTYSDVDMNGHTNNAMYIVWAMDALDYGITSGKPVTDVRINFNHETRPGDIVELYRAVREEGDSCICHIEGQVEGNSALCVELSFMNK